MIRFYTLLALFMLLFPTVYAAQVNDSTALPAKVKKVEFKFSGRVDLMLFSDSHKAIESRGGVQFICSDKPTFNDQGVDMNQVQSLRWSVAPTRVNATVLVNDIARGATGKAFVEVDFMGLNESMTYSLRMRHAYFSLNWKRQNLLFGQTSHLTMPDEMAANTVTFGGGYPFNPLSRPVQIQFTQRWGQHAGNVAIAAAMHGGNFGTMQSRTMVPDVQLRLTLGRQDRLLFGMVGGFKTAQPRTFTADSSRTSKRINTFNAAAFLKYSFLNGHSLRLFGIWGQDLSPLSIIGGYAPLVEHTNTNIQNYGYAPVGAISLWLDYDSRSYRGFQYGLFFGMQKNLGTDHAVMLTDITSIPNKGLDMFMRVAPRIWYSYGKHLQFGLEYSFNQATWGKEMNTYYRPSQTYEPTVDHRVTFLARFKF